mmetsp:Transcript_5430/g.15714  ORF Transcript_5430/g.15714 Transcript_5430/m.15714 type:complete len:205 (-) Transcript_5430:2056-2670(-)
MAFMSPRPALIRTAHRQATFNAHMARRMRTSRTIRNHAASSPFSAMCIPNSREVPRMQMASSSESHLWTAERKYAQPSCANLNANSKTNTTSKAASTPMTGRGPMLLMNSDWKRNSRQIHTTLRTTTTAMNKLHVLTLPLLISRSTDLPLCDCSASDCKVANVYLSQLALLPSRDMPRRPTAAAGSSSSRCCSRRAISRRSASW